MQLSNVLSCILVLPHVQRRGYGKFLINVAYEFAYRENRFGTAERPLSALGKASFYSFWAGKILDHIDIGCEGTLTLGDVSNRSGITPEDIAECLRDVGVLKEVGKTMIWLNTDEAIAALKKKAGSRGFPFETDRLEWVPDTVFGGTSSENNQVATPSGEFIISTTVSSTDSPV